MLSLPPFQSLSLSIPSTQSDSYFHYTHIHLWISNPSFEVVPHLWSHPFFCYAILLRVVRWYVMSYRVVLCCVVLWCVVLCCVVLCRVVSCRVVSCRVVSYNMWCYATSVICAVWLDYFLTSHHITLSLLGNHWGCKRDLPPVRSNGFYVRRLESIKRR